MPAWLSIALTIFYVLWLCGVLILLYFIWRSSAQRTAKLEQTLISTTDKTQTFAQTCAEAAHMAAEAALLLAKGTVPDDLTH